MKKILITGSTGFIGSYLTKKLNENNEVIVILRKKNLLYENFLKKKNIIIYKNYLDLNKKLSKMKIDILIHCATHYVKNHTFSDIDKLAHSNLIYGNIILENLIKMRVKKFINFSTVWENYNGVENNSYNLYACYKKSFSQLIKFYESKYKSVKFYNLIIADTFGLKDNRKKIITVLKSNLQKKLITKIISKKLYINLLNVKDILNAVILIINNKIIPSTYNLNGIKFNIKNLIDKFNLESKKKLNVKYLSNKTINEKIFSYKKLPKWKPRFTTYKEIFDIIDSTN